jgi:hypothetical protein
VLIAGGMLNLAYGTLLGYPITVIRVKGAPVTPKYLMAAHVSALLHAAILLGLAWAARLSALNPGWLDLAAWLVVVSSALIAAKDSVNWLMGVKDEFSDEPKTARAVGRARRVGNDSWHWHLRRRRPQSAMTQVITVAWVGRPAAPGTSVTASYPGALGSRWNVPRPHCRLPARRHLYRGQSS